MATGYLGGDMNYHFHICNPVFAAYEAINKGYITYPEAREALDNMGEYGKGHIIVAIPN